jgi:hypothetical protein
LNYLQLVQRLHKESGAGGDAPVAVTALSGEAERLANWVNNSYQDIQNKNTNWRFMWAEFSFNTVATQGDYVPAAVLVNNPGLELARFDRFSFRYYLASAGVNSEQHMRFRDYQLFRDIWRFGAARTAPGAPLYWTQAPDRDVLLAQIPDAIYTIVGQFYRRPALLAVNTDTPIFPEEFHMAIVWWALIKYAGFEEKSAVYTNAQNQLGLVMTPMELQELPDLMCAGPLA